MVPQNNAKPLIQRVPVLTRIKFRKFDLYKYYFSITILGLLSIGKLNNATEWTK